MPMDLSETVATLTGICEVADAEPLLVWLQAHPQGQVDVSRCEHAHTAIVQVLMAAQPTLVGMPAGAGERAWLSAFGRTGEAV